MSHTDFQLRGVDDPRLAVHATGRRPAWLWSVDGTRILWANPIGARLFGARSGAELTAKSFGPADPHRRQMAQLSGRLPPGGAVRLERLRGFGAALGRLMTCACTRLEFSDGGAGILVVAAEATGRAMPLVERLRNLVDGIDTPIAAFARDGAFIGASDAARALLGFHNLADAGLDAARDDALKDGRVETPIGIGRMVLQRVGSGADVGLVALIAPGAARQPLPAEPEASALETSDEPEASEQKTEPENVAAVEHDDAPVADTPSPEVEPVDAEPVDAEPVAEEPFDAEPVRTRLLRFTWQMDADGVFSLNSDEFIHLIGAPIAAALGQRWTEIATTFDLDPDGRVLKAVATRNIWSGITVFWPVSWPISSPVDGGGRLTVELSGLPVTDRDHHFAGYRGFGICRDLNELTLAATQRRAEAHGHPPRRLSADIAQAGPAGDELDDPDPAPSDAPIIEPPEPSPPATPDIIVEQSKNVVQLRPVDLKSPALTPIENRAFNELARQLSARLERDNALVMDAAPVEEPEAAPQQPPVEMTLPPEEPIASEHLTPDADRPDWLATPAAPARGEWLRDRTLLDLLPVGVLIYRLDRLLYANPAFLARTGYPTLLALEEAGGLDALYVEPDVSRTSSTSDGGTAVKISATEATDAPAFQPADARLFTISWDDEPALALIFASDRAEPVAAAGPAATGPAVMAVEPSPAGHANAEELAAILDTTADGIIMFDAEGRINSCNRSAEALFGHDGETLTRLNLVDLFAPESQRAVGDYLDGIKGAGVASLLDHGREALGRVHAGGFIPLSLMMGRTRQDGPNFFAVFRDLSQAKKTETELLNARRQAERAATAKADVLARISHEVRTPLNAIIGFAEVMTEERFGPLGNERYVDYMKDIRVSGERVIAIINDLLDLSRIETGKLDLAFTSQNLNEIVEQCVAVMQPQANRGRIIIRTSLAHLLPTVIADTRALRQIALNLIANSIHLANAGGQVIVSTALTDFGEVVLRVRDTGHGMNDNELAAAMEPFRAPAPADRAIDGGGVNLSLTKALVEANRARFQIKTAPSSGTLIEVVFSHAAARV